MKKVKVSILVPVYGVEKYIERCAHSLFYQTFENVEYIFVDDCTKDESISILKAEIAKHSEIIAKSSIIHHENNKGIAAARRTALEAAKGEYILFVDSDDYIEADMVELLYNKALEVDADMVFCSYQNEYSNNTSKIFHVKPMVNKVELVKNAFSYPSFWNKMFKREIMTLNRLEIQNGINYGEDLSIVPQLIYHSKTFAFVEKPLYHYIHYNTNSSTREFSTENLNQTLKVITTLNEFFMDKPEYKESILLLKAIRKAKILRSGQTEKQYVDLFPEINSTIKLLDIDHKTRMILQLAARKQYLLLKLLVSILIFRRNSHLSNNSL
jgi:glycosyltransferase involved in cell wall biosynthesis